MPDLKKDIDADPDWATISGGKTGKDTDKDKKKTKKSSIWDDLDKADDEPAQTLPEPEADTGWGAFSSKKDRDKKKVKKDAEEIKAVSPEPIVEDTASIWGTSSTKSKDKKGKKGLISEVKDDSVTA